MADKDNIEEFWEGLRPPREPSEPEIREPIDNTEPIGSTARIIQRAIQRRGLSPAGLPYQEQDTRVSLESIRNILTEAYPELPRLSLTHHARRLLEEMVARRAAGLPPIPLHAGDYMIRPMETLRGFARRAGLNIELGSGEGMPRTEEERSRDIIDHFERVASELPLGDMLTQIAERETSPFIFPEDAAADTITEEGHLRTERIENLVRAFEDLGFTCEAYYRGSSIQILFHGIGPRPSHWSARRDSSGVLRFFVRPP